MENFSVLRAEKLPDWLVNEAIRSLRLDQAVLVTEHRSMAEAFAQFVFALMGRLAVAEKHDSPGQMLVMEEAL